MSEEEALCWQSNKASRSASASPVPYSSSKRGGPRTANSTPSSPRRQKIGLPRQRQSMSGSSPLHVAAMFASAAMAAKTAIGSGETSSNTMRQDSLNRLYMTSDEVFKAWEASLKIDEEEEKKFQQQQACNYQNRVIKKFSSIELCDTAAIRRHQVLQKQQQQNPNAMGAEEDADTNEKVKDKLSPDADPTAMEQHPLGRSVRTSILRRHSSSIKPQTAVQAIGQLADARRRFSGALTNDSSNIKKVDLDAEYNVRKQLGTGRFGYVKLGEHKQSGMKIAMKFFPRPQTKQADFVREYNFSHFLSPHPNILDTFEGIFQAKDESAFFFVQEFCPNASLREAVESHPGGIGETATKAIMVKVLSAIEFMHGEGLVHRNIKAENILIFDSVNYSRVKVTDFGLTRKTETTVRHLEYVNSYHAPGKQYWEWDQWLKHKLPQLPKHYELYTEKALKLFKRCLNPRPKDRWTVKDLKKFVEKERLVKVKSSGDDLVYYPDENNCKSDQVDSGNSKQKKSTITKLINTTFNAMAVVSEQVVSAHD